MSSQITTAFTQQYSNNVKLLAQEKGSQLRNTVNVETVVGKNAFFDQVGVATAVKRTTRHADTLQVDTPHSRRRVSLVDYEYADLIDNQDKVRTLIDPTSSYAIAAAYALGRAVDDEIISAVTGTAYTGEAGSTSTTFTSGNAITESGSDGLTLAKLRNAKQILDSNSVDPSIPKFIIVAPVAISDLLAVTQATSSDYASVKALVQGEIDTFMGFKFVVSNRLSKTGNLRKLLVYAQDGMLLALGQDLVTRIDERSDKGYATQVYCSQSVGATRMEEEKCVSIETYEA